jgi:hypothetical protein
MRTVFSAAAAVAACSLPLLAQGALVAPCFEPVFGTNLNLGDDQVSPPQALGFTFPGPGGTNVTTIGVSSNGFVWLDNSVDPGCCEGQETKFLTRGPRLAPLWVDLDPATAGAVWFRAEPASGSLPARAIVTWDDVPEFQTGASMTFQLQLFADGSVLFFYDPFVFVQIHDSLVGITPGGGAAVNAIDLTATANGPHDSGALPSVYEVMPWFQCDLAASSWTFVPNGQGGYVVAAKAICGFGVADPYGIGCPEPATFYERFALGQALDVANSALEFFPAGGGGYLAAPVPGFFQGYTNAVSLGDEQTSGPIALPFSFAYPGGATTAIEIASNGFVWLQAGNTDTRCCNGDVNRFLFDPASIAGWWTDLDPSAAPPGGGVFFDVVGTTEAHITWAAVPEPFAGGSSTFQITLRNDGSFRLAWGNLTNVAHDVLVGFAQGFGNVDPGPRDLSAGTFTTGVGGVPLRLSSQFGSRPLLGTTYTMELDQVPPGSLLAVMVFGFAAIPGGFDLTSIGGDGCRLYTSLDTLVPFALTGTFTSYGFAVPPSPPLAGVGFSAQAATLTPALNVLGFATSNGMAITLGY